MKNKTKYTDIVEVKVDYESVKSIELAEAAKSNLESSGYNLINTFGGTRHASLIYGKI